MLRKSLLFFLVLASSCTKFNNRFNEIQHVCGLLNWQGLDHKRIFLLKNPEGREIDPRLVEKATWNSESGGASHPLTLSPGGCVIVEDSGSGILQIGVPKGSLGLVERVEESERFRELSLKTIGRNAPQLTCGTKRVVASAKDLLLPISASKIAPADGTRIYWEITNVSNGKSTLIPLGMQETSEIPDGNYLVKAVSVNVLERVESSDACPIRLEAKLPPPPQMHGPNLVKAGGAVALDFSGNQGMTCLESSEKPMGKCLREENFFRADGPVSFSRPGSWKLFAYSISSSGVRSPVVSWILPVDSQGPDLSLRWANADLGGQVSVVRNYGTTFRVEGEVSDDTTQSDALMSSLQCRVRIHGEKETVLRMGKAKCITGRCEGKLLDDWIPCSLPFEFQLLDEKSLWETRISAEVKVEDGLGTKSQKSLAAWFLRDSVEQWSTFEGQSHSLRVGSVRAIELGSEYIWLDDRAVIASDKGVFLYDEPSRKLKSISFRKDVVSVAGQRSEIWGATQKGEVFSIALDSFEEQTRLRLESPLGELVRVENGLLVSGESTGFQSFSSENGRWVLDGIFSSFPGVVYRYRQDPAGVGWGMTRNQIVKDLQVAFESPEAIVDFSLGGFPEKREAKALLGDRIVNFQLRDGRLNPISEEPNSENFSRLAALGNGKFVGYGASGVHGLGANGPSKVAFPDNYMGAVNSVWERPNGSVWFGTDNGAYKFEGCSWATFTEKSHGMTGRILRVFESEKHPGVVFQVMRNGKVAMLRDGVWESLPDIADVVFSFVHEDRNGVLWVLDSSAIIRFIDPHSLSPEWKWLQSSYPPTSCEEWSHTCSIRELPDGTLAFRFPGELEEKDSFLLYLNPSRNAVSLRQRSFSGNVSFVNESEREWAFHNGVFVNIPEGSNDMVPMNHALPAEFDVLELFRNSSGDLFSLLTDGSVFRFTGSSWLRMTPSLGMPPSEGARATGLMVSNSGNIYYSDADAGLVKWRSGERSRIPSGDLAVGMESVFETSAGDLWSYSTTSGVAIEELEHELGISIQSQLAIFNPFCSALGFGDH